MTENTSLSVGSQERSLRELAIRVIPLIILIIDLANHLFLPNKQSTNVSNSYTAVLIAGITAYSIVFLLSIKSSKLWHSLRNKAILLSAAFLVLTVWDLATRARARCTVKTPLLSWSR